MRANPLLLHLEHAMGDQFLAGDLVDQDEVDMVVMGGSWGWDQELEDLARRFTNQGKLAYAYLQVFTAPLPEWQNTEPHQTMGELPTIPLVEAWAHSRPAIDWPRVSLGDLWNQLKIPLGVTGFFLDNFFPDLAPWMFKKSEWWEVPGLGALKRKHFAIRLRAFTQYCPQLITNGVEPPFSSASTWVMVERAAARRYEAESRVRDPGNVIISIPAEETWNLPWILNLWTSRPGVALSFTSDSPTFGAASIYAYQRAIEHRRVVGLVVE